MKEKIYTIPVNDAFNDGQACPLCSLEDKTTEDLLNYYLGPSMMESDVRQTTNAKGFCSSHLSSLYNKQENRLGLGLILHTHLKDVDKDLTGKLKKLGEGKSVGGGVGGLLTSRRDFKSNLIRVAELIEQRVESCVLCDRLDYTMDRYVDVILWQFFEEKQFRDKFTPSAQPQAQNQGQPQAQPQAQNQGQPQAQLQSRPQNINFCMSHLALLLRGANKYLSASQAEVFVKALAGMEHVGILNLLEDIEWFTLKFDYKNQDKPWKNSKDAIPRTIGFLQGPSVDLIR